ncbi:hypothetical protein HYALB_00003123 [Hymenoscyphus albidus]|uniref:RlpA-like protein double-psi beta-barrel domain-containing protein n=1 Tax=Hymenoscyphus albidus TaxID=595503 RepID=A0A9N9PXE7_9HELO|nr:hypothetical protein HYALB_00003123 [Hymenoscyphus albidus]
MTFEAIPTTTSKMQLPQYILVTLALALPLASAFGGKATFYEPNSLGSCGQQLTADSGTVALSRSHDGNCGRTVPVTSNGRSVTAKVADACSGCGTDGIDLTKSKFLELGGNVGTASLSVSWDFV